MGLPEPTLAEVVRGIERIEASIADMRAEVASTYVRGDVHAQLHTRVDERNESVESRVGVIETAAVEHARFRRYVLPLQVVTWVLSIGALAAAILIR